MGRKRKQGKETEYEAIRHTTGRYSNVGILLNKDLGNEVHLQDIGYKLVYHTKNELFISQRNQIFGAILADSHQGEDAIILNNEERRQTVETETPHFENKKDHDEQSSGAHRLSKHNVDGFNAIECLKLLNDIDLIKEVEWVFCTLSDTRDTSKSYIMYEEVKLSISLSDSKKIEFSKKRDTRIHSRKVMKHDLASNAMDKIFENFSTPWHEMSVKEKKNILSHSHKSNTEHSNKNAL
jgi:hypothetical protein